MFRAVFPALLAVAIFTAALPARAEHAIDPGLWQLTETAVEDSKPGKPDTKTDCVSAEEAHDPIKTMLKDAEGLQCDALDVKENGNTVAVEMKCNDPKGESRMEIDTIINFLGARHYTGTIKSLVIFRGQRLSSQAMIDAKWIAPSCYQ